MSEADQIPTVTRRERRRSSLVLRIDIVNDASRKTNLTDSDLNSGANGVNAPVTTVTSGIKLPRNRKLSASLTGQASDWWSCILWSDFRCHNVLKWLFDVPISRVKFRRLSDESLDPKAQAELLCARALKTLKHDARFERTQFGSDAANVKASIHDNMERSELLDSAERIVVQLERRKQLDLIWGYYSIWVDFVRAW